MSTSAPTIQAQSNALLKTSDLLAGLSGIAIEKATRPQRANAKEFGKYTLVSVLSRMVSSSGLNQSVQPGNQQYLFAAIGGGAISGGSGETMLKSAAYAGLATYAGDVAAVKLDWEKDLIGGN